MRLPWLAVVVLVACRGALGPTAPTEPPPPADVVARLDPEGFAPPIVDDATHRRAPGLASVGPREVGVARASESAQPFVHFAQPMRTDGPAPTFVLDPPVEGDAVWIDPYRAWFMPRHPLQLGQRYRVQVTGTPATATGAAIEIAESWEFVTRPPFVELAVHDASYWDGESPRPRLHWLTPVIVRSELRVVAKDLVPHLRARAWKTGSDPRRAKPVPLRMLERGDLDPLPDSQDLRGDLRIYPRTRWPVGSHVVVELDPAFAPPGAGPIGSAVLAEFDVTDGVHASTSCMQDHGDGCGPLGFWISFDRDVAAALMKHITIEPRPKGLKIDAQESYAMISGGFLPDRRYRVRLGRAIRDEYGQALAGPRTFEVRIVPPPPTVQLVGSSGIVRPDLQPTIGLEARYVRRALLRAAVPSERTWAALADRDLADVPFPTEVEHLVEREIDLSPRGRYAWSSIAVDLAELAHGEPRPVLVEVVPLQVMSSARKRPRPEVTRGLYQLSGLGAAAWMSHGEARLQLRALASLDAVKGAAIDVVHPDGRVVHSGHTDAQGIAELPHDRALPPESYVVAKTDRDRLLVRIGPAKPPEPEEPGARRGWYEDRGEDRMLSSVVTERAIYRPGEHVSVVGWAAISTPRTNHGLARPKTGTPVELTLLDRHGEIAAKRTVRTTAHGKYWARLPLRDDVPLGSFRAVAKIGEEEFSAYFEVRDVRLPEFEVQASAVDSELQRGDTAEIVAHANYYFGGTVKIEDARGTTNCRPRWSLPPGVEPGWSMIGLADEDGYRDAARVLPSGPKTTADGEARVQLATADFVAGIGHDCLTELAIQDAAFGEVGSSTPWFVHPSSYLLVHVKAPAPDRHELQVRAVDGKGVRRDGPSVTIAVSRVERVERKDGRVDERLTEVHRCRLEPTARADAACKTPKLRPGRYRAVLTATVDGAAMAWRDEWWAHEPQTPRKRTPGEHLTLTVDELDPQPGHRLRVELDGPVGTNHGMLAVSHLGLRRLVPFRLERGHATLHLPVTDAWIPDVTLHAFVVVPGARPKDRPRVFVDEQHLEVAHASRGLQVAVEAAEVARAGAELPITVRVADPQGKPVAGHVAVWAVDEALHSLVEPRIPDFLSTFAVRRYLPTRWVETYSSVLEPYEPVDDPFEFGLGTIGGGFGGGSGGGSGSAKGALDRPAARQKFEGTPIFVGDAIVGRDGIARVKGRLPDNLTTFRITAIASADVVSGPGVGRFGHDDARVRVTAPLVVRAALPRMLRPGDEAEAAALVDNLGGPAGKVKVEIVLTDAQGRLELVEAPKGAVAIAAGGQVRVPFRIRARGTGVAHVEARAKLSARGRGADLVDAVRLPLPIERANDLVRYAAAYGSSAKDGSFAVALTRPVDLDRRTVAVEVALSGSMLAGLEDLAKDLAQYPYGCVEQTSSGLLPLAALGGLQRAGFLATDVDAHVAAGIARLRSMQIDGGGLAYWPGGTRPHAYGTAYALWVLEQLRANGHDVPASLRDGMRDWLADRVGVRRVLPRDEDDDASDEVTERFDDITAVIAVQALVAAGDRPTSVLARLHERRATLPTFARALLLLAAHEADPGSTIAKELRTELLAQIDERQGVASVRPGDSVYDELFDSSTRTEAMVLLALLQTAPAEPKVEKLMRHMSQLRAAGSIANTQERAYALLAFADWARREESVPADLVAELWVGERATKDATLRGRAAPAVVRNGRIDAPARGDVGRVTMRRNGEGRLYWRIGMAWTPKDAGRKPSAHGIAIERRLRDASGTVREDLRAGELLAMDVTIRVDAATSYVAVDLPLPPGLEAVDETLGKGQRARKLPGGRGGWVSHQELRADRAVVFADVLVPGTHHTTVFLRATTPGRYEMPPAVAHAMYAPEIRGHTTRTSVRVAAPAR